MSDLAERVLEDQEAAGYGRPLMVKLSRIMRYDGQPRRYFDPSDTDILARDIMANGHKTPCKVCKYSLQRGVFVLIGGERRWRAFHKIAEWAKTDPAIAEAWGTDPLVKCFIDAVRDEKHHFREALLDNLRREDLIPVDEAAALQRLYDDSEAKTRAAKIKEIAEVIGKSSTYVENYLFMHSLPGEVKDLMDPRRKERRLTTTAAIDIARSTRNTELRIAIAKESVERGLGITDTRGLIAVRTGQRGYGIGGRLRKPSDDYKVWKGYVARTLTQAQRFRNHLDLVSLYANRDSERTDRAYDGAELDSIIRLLTELREQVRPTQAPARPTLVPAARLRARE
jgi:ParB/RepB/Spo0J family partition protein